MKKRGQIIILFAAIIACCAAVFFHAFMVEASERKENLPHTNYQVGKGSSYSFGSDDTLTYFEYGQTSLGNLYIKGELNDGSMYNGVNAFGTNGNITFGYDYNNAYQNTSKDNWNLVNSDWFEDKITIENEQIKTSKNIDNGAMIVQKSSDRLSWENVASVSNFFNDKTSRDSVYTTTEEELKVGTYYRVVIVYTMQKRTKAAWGPLPDEYDKKTFAEVYEVYLCSDKNYISVHNLSNRGSLTLPATVSNGFYIQKNGSSATVYVQNGKGSNSYALDNATFTNPGEYTINVTTKLNKTYSYKITVNNGLSLKALRATTYECADNKGYKTENKMDDSAECCAGNHLTLFVGHNSQKDIVQSTRSGVASYGVYGNAAELYVSLGTLYQGWSISSDSWGKKEKETVDGVTTGEVGTGALIIQKSSDGVEWTRIDAGKYANGLYTTDFEANYGINGKVLIYSPEGSDVLNGTYYRVLYAYEAKKDKTTKNYIEEYVFYLCNASTESVTFKNKTVSNSLNLSLSEMDNSTADIYRSAESMLSGSYTTTGFRIDKSLNPIARIEVKKNGIWIGNSVTEVTDTGRYDVTISSAVGNSQLVTIYVDRDDNDVVYKRYFGDSFVQGVRVFANGDYPVFEAGSETKYNIEKIGSEYAPIYGTITNNTTKEVIEIAASTEAKSGKLSAGEYVAVFNTNPTYSTENKSGDNRVFTFRFTIIEEGTAPGPVINKQRLYDYAKSTVADAYPAFYGLTYQSAARGTITLAFATEKAAIDFAYNYEKGDAEEVGDGTFNYKGTSTIVDGPYQYSGSFVKQKENYENGWTLADAIYNYAKQSVQKSYFNYGSIYSLSEDVISATENLRQLELNHSVVVFADATQKALLTELECLPLISDKPYLYSVPSKSNSDSGYVDFEFTSDIYGADSYEVIITDCEGKEYVIEYNKSVGAQLQQAGCPSGIVTIIEKTKFGKACEPYNAVFIANGDNTGIIKISYENAGQTKSMEFSQDKHEYEITCDKFSIESVTDELDPYGLVSVSRDGNTIFFAENEHLSDEWILAGKYTVCYKNRLGYYFQITINVRENSSAVIKFDGAASDEIDSINTSYGEKNVKLPDANRYGYDFAGYVDADGNVYTNEISSILFKGEMVLNTTWKPKQFVLTTIVNGDEQKYDILYGKQIDLPKPNVPNGYEFVSWTLNGEELAENVYTLIEEKDVVLQANLKKLTSSETPTKEPGVTVTPEQSEESQKGVSPLVWIIPVLVILLGLGSFLGYKYYLKKQKAE